MEGPAPRDVHASGAKPRPEGRVRGAWMAADTRSQHQLAGVMRPRRTVPFGRPSGH
jgi:hypothetical protein